MPNYVTNQVRITAEDMIEFYCKVHDLDIEEFKEDIGREDAETEEAEPSSISDEERAKLE